MHNNFYLMKSVSIILCEISTQVNVITIDIGVSLIIKHDDTEV